MQIPPGPHLGDLVVRAEGVRKGYGDNLLMEDMNFDLPKGGLDGMLSARGIARSTLVDQVTATLVLPKPPGDLSTAHRPSVQFQVVELALYPDFGVRPNPLFGNIVEVIDDAASRQHTVNVFWQVNILPPSPAPSKELWNWKRTNFGLNYGFGKQENNTDGAFSVPATGSLVSEWGPATFDVRHRVNGFFTLQWLKRHDYI